MQVTEDKELAFIHAAMRLGLITLERIDEALKIKSEMLAQGKEATLEDVLVSRGFLTDEQCRRVINTLTMRTGVALPGMELQERKWMTAYATWFRAKVEQTQKMVLVKVLSRNASERLAISERFIRECKTFSRVRHPNFMRIYDATKTNGITYMACEDAEGTSLKELVTHSGPMSEDKALKILKSMAEVLAVLHKNGLTHRNIKPENIILMPGSIPVLADPGLVRPVLQGAEWDDPDPFAANFHYLSPEQLEKKDVGPASDIYSLGAVIWFCLTGGPIFTGTDPRRIIDQYLKDPLPDIKEIFEGLSESTAVMLKKMLAREPEDRFADGASLCELLGITVPEGGMAKTQIEKPPSKPPTKKAEEKPKPAPAPSAPTPPTEIAAEPEPAPGPTPATAPTIEPKKSKKVLWLSLAAVAVVAAVAAIFLTGGEDKKKKPHAPSPIAKPTPPPPKPDPEAEKKARLEEDARACFEEAQAAFKALSWQRAHEHYLKLQAEFGGTQFFAQNQKLIVDNIEVCVNGMAAQKNPPPEPKPPEPPPAAVAPEFNEAKQLMDSGSFKAAHDKLQGVLLKLPESEAENRAQVRALIEKCRRELMVDEDMARLRELSKSASWDQIVLAVGSFQKEHRETRRYVALKPEVDAILSQANEIGEFHTAVKEIRDANAASDWAKVVLLVDQFNTRFAMHPLFDAVRNEFADLARRAQKNLLMPAEEKAKAEFAKAEAALDAKKFQDAIIGYDILLKDLAETELVRSNKTLIDQHRDLAVQGFRKERDAEGNRKFKTARSLFDAKNWVEAQKILADLDRNYADVVPEKLKEIRQMLEQADKEVAAELAALVDDGEKGIENWIAGGATARVQAEEAADAKVGSKSIRMTFKKHDESVTSGTWPRLEHAVAPPSDETTALSFWGKSGNAQPFKISIELRLYSGDDEVVYAATRTLGPGWQLYQIPLTEFKQVWQHPRRKAPARLNAYNIQKVGFSSGQPTSESSAILDQIRFEAKR